VDTICTLCSKGCSTTAWLKAKPEWAKGARLIRVTPRFNPHVNGYWMCDIGLEYHWVESEDRLRQPLVRDEGGFQQPVSWESRTSEPTSRLDMPTGKDSKASRRSSSDARSRPRTGCRRQIHRNVGSGSSCSRICRP